MKVSIITATYNCAHLLESCLISVANQKGLESIEHIIVDGASTDGTLDVVAKYPHVRKVFSAPDRGIYHAFNRGVEMATGDIVYFLGADDTLYADDVITRTIDTFDANEIDYVVTKVRCFDEETSEAWLTNVESDKSSNTCHQGFFCRSSLFNKIGPFSECFSLYADSFFMKTAMRHYKGKFSDIVSANFRQGGASSSSTSRLVLKREADAVSQLLGEKGVSNELQLDKNVTDLKTLLEKVTSERRPLVKYAGMRVGIFGTRGLSQTVARIFSQYDVFLVCFIVSNKSSITPLGNVPVLAIEEVKHDELDLVVNCIEGSHEKDIYHQLKQHLADVNVKSWREL